jgi:hypothetical protein
LDWRVPNSCCSRSTPNDDGGSTATLSRTASVVSNVCAYSRGVSAASAPIDSPDASRPVTFVAARIVVFAGESTKSPDAEPRGDAPIRRL